MSGGGGGGSAVAGGAGSGQWLAVSGLRGSGVPPALVAPPVSPTGGGVHPPAAPYRWGVGDALWVGGPVLPGGCPVSLILPHPHVPIAWDHHRRARPSPAPPLEWGLGLRGRWVPPAVAPVGEGGAQGPGEPVAGLCIRDAEHRPPLQESRPRQLPAPVILAAVFSQNSKSQQKRDFRGKSPILLVSKAPK